MTDTEKMRMTNIIGNFVGDNIVFGMEMLAHHLEEQSTNFLLLKEREKIYI